MQSWEIIKKDKNGDKYEIRIIFQNRKFIIDDVGYIQKGKRKAVYLGARMKEDYSWRSLNMENRRAAQKEEILKVVPEHLLLEAITDVWKELQPNIVNF